MKDLRIVARIYNNQLRERREALGLSAPQLAEKIGIDYVSYIGLEAMRNQPVGSKGWKPIALKIADFYLEPVEKLFPASVLAIRQIETERRVDAEEIAALSSGPPSTPLQLVESAETHEALYSAVLNALDEKERLVISMRYGLTGESEERTLEEVGEALGVSRERIRQIEAKALRKLRLHRGTLPETVTP